MYSMLKIRMDEIEDLIHGKPCLYAPRKGFYWLVILLLPIDNKILPHLKVATTHDKYSEKGL